MQPLPSFAMFVWRARSAAVLACLVAIAVGRPIVGAALAGQVPSRYTTGREILKLDFANTALGDFPTGIKTLNGTMDVVEKGGVHMLRASSPSEVLVQLPQVLPQEFTIELDIVPKQCCAPDDIAIEGTDIDHRGPGTAQVTWQTPRISVVGGAPDMYQAPMPDVLQTSTPGALTQIVLTVQNQTMQLFTNGRRLFTLTDRKFARRNILWLMLGGADDGPNAMYLARLRIVDPTVITPAVAGQCPPGSPGCPPATGDTTSPPASTQSSAGSSPGPGTSSAGKLTPGPSGIQTTAIGSPGWGVSVLWKTVPNATGYRVTRAVTAGGIAVAVDLVTNGATPCAAAATIGGQCGGVDAFVLPNTSYTYWVEASLGQLGELSAPSATSTAATADPPPIPEPIASVGATKLMTMTGALASLGTISGSEVTWTWKPPARSQFAYAYSYEILDGVAGVGPVFDRGIVRNPDPLNGTAALQVVRGVPQGKMVRFCLALAADPDVTKPLDPNYRTCVGTQVF